MRIDLPTPESLSLTDLKPDTIARVLQASQEGILTLQRLQQRTFAATFVRFFHEHPEASIFVCGQTGEYTDEGYAGCWVARIDPTYVRERAATSTSKRDGYYSRDVAANKTFDADVREFRKDTYDKNFEVLPHGLEAFSLPEFEAFSNLSTLQEVWQDVANFSGDPSNGGMVYQKQDLKELLAHLGENVQEMTALIESEALTARMVEQGVDLTAEKRKGKAKKAL